MLTQLHTATLINDSEISSFISLKMKNALATEKLTFSKLIHWPSFIEGREYWPFDEERDFVLYLPMTILYLLGHDNTKIILS